MGSAEKNGISNLWFWDAAMENWTYIDTLVDGFSVTENPSYFDVIFTYQATMDGTHGFVLSVYVDGEFLTFETIYFYDACAYNP